MFFLYFYLFHYVHIPSSKRIMKDNGTETRTNVTTNEQALHGDAAVIVAGQSIDSPADLRSRHHGQKYVDNIAMNFSSTKDYHPPA